MARTPESVKAQGIASLYRHSTGNCDVVVEFV
jgi:hypothetical protein